MNRCSARLRPYLGASPTGFPEVHYRDVCRQAVGIRSIWDGNDRERFYCSLAGHLGDVVAQMNADLLAERVRHDTAPEPRAAMPVTASDWQGIRPEMARSLR